MLLCFRSDSDFTIQTFECHHEVYEKQLDVVPEEDEGSYTDCMLIVLHV